MKFKYEKTALMRNGGLPYYYPFPILFYQKLSFETEGIADDDVVPLFYVSA
jgi:hypothetical protein